jgi:hypothetical protein
LLAEQQMQRASPFLPLEVETDKWSGPPWPQATWQEP